MQNADTAKQLTVTQQSQEEVARVKEQLAFQVEQVKRESELKVCPLWHRALPQHLQPTAPVTRCPVPAGGAERPAREAQEGAGGQGRRAGPRAGGPEPHTAGASGFDDWEWGSGASPGWKSGPLSREQAIPGCHLVVLGCSPDPDPGPTWDTGTTAGPQGALSLMGVITNPQGPICKRRGRVGGVWELCSHARCHVCP